MKVCRAALIAAVAVMTDSNAFAQAKTVTPEVAKIMVQEAVTKCRAEGAKITAKVVDAANVEKALLRDEGAGAITVEFVQAKINTVILTGRASGGPGGNPTMIKGVNPKVMVMGAVMGMDMAAGKLISGVEAGGAVPIMIGGEMVGVIGVSGAPSAATDIACANAGIAKVADKLK